MSTAGRSNMVTGLFPDRESAEHAYNTTTSRGYGRDDVNLLMSDETRSKYFSSDDTANTDLGNKAMEGAGVGGGIGTAVGATLGALAAIGTNLVLPGLGLVIAGPLAAGLAGAGAGALTGGLVGALVGWGIPEERARAYESGISKGGIVMGIRPRSDDDAAYIEREWKTRGEHISR